MRCPRCLKFMIRFDMPTPDGGTAWIERCERNASCGCWYADGQLPALHASFAQPEVMAAFSRAPKVAVSDAQRVKCHRCESTPEMTAVQFVGITLDRCDECHGVWVDRDEYAALMHALQLRQTEGVMAPTHYRSAAVQTTLSRKPGAYARCVACKVEAAYSDVIFTERGLMCFACGTRHAQQD